MDNRITLYRFSKENIELGEGEARLGNCDATIILKYKKPNGSPEILYTSPTFNQDLYDTTEGDVAGSGEGPLVDNFIGNFFIPFDPPTITHNSDIGGMYYIEVKLDNVDRGTLSRIDFETFEINMTIAQSVQPPSDGELLSVDGNIIISEIEENGELNKVYTFGNFSDSQTGVDGTVYNYTFTSDLSPFMVADKKYKMGFEIDKTFNTSFFVDDIKAIFKLEKGNMTSPYRFPSLFRSPQTFKIIIENYFGPNLTPFSKAYNFQPLLNNFIEIRENNRVLDVKYDNNENVNVPNNIDLIISGDAKKASVPDSNYTSYKSTSLKFLGSKTSSLFLNRWTPNDKNTFGKTPVLELRDSFFGYFNELRDPYPNKNGVLELNLNYLIDSSGNVIAPSIESGGMDILLKTFSIGSLTSIALNQADKTLKDLSNNIPVENVGTTVFPIFYTQTSGDNYTTTLDFKNIDNIDIPNLDGGGNEFKDLSFKATGEGNTSLNFPLNNFDIDLKPQNVHVFNLTDSPTPPTPFNISNGNLQFNQDIGSTNTTQDYTITLDTSVGTTFLFESGDIELFLKLTLESNNDGNLDFNLNSLELIVYKENGSPINVGNIINNENDAVRFVTSKVQQNIGLNTNNSLEMLIENFAINDILRKKNLLQPGGGVENGGDIIGYEFKIKASTQPLSFNQSDTVKWNIKGDIRGRNGNGTNVFYPSGVFNKIFPTSIQTIGSKNNSIIEDGKVFFTNLWDRVGNNKLRLNPALLNVFYGGNFIQRDIPYVPNLTENNGVKFDKIKTSFKLEVGDEIRFMNNELYVYKIINIIPPENSSNGKLEIKVNRPISPNIDLSFCLIRRNLGNPNSITLGYDYRGGEVLNGGVLYPEYPSSGLKSNSPRIISDLIGKGIIK